MEEGVPIEHKMVTNAIARAQKQVEAQNFSVRKHLLEYDDVMNKQRESVYALRREILEGKVHLTEESVVDLREYLMTLAEELLESTTDRYASADIDPDERDHDALKTAVAEIYGLEAEELEVIDVVERNAAEITDALWQPILRKYESKEGLIPAEILRRVERDIMLQIVDAQWKDHLYSLDHLKEGIGLRGYGQRDPLVEYKKESFSLFQAMKDRIEEEMVRYLWRLTPVIGDDPNAEPVRQPAPRRPPQMTMHAQQAPAPSPFGAFSGAGGSGSASAVAEPPRPARTGGDDAIKQVKRDEPKVGRNDPCPCGSGKKYKKCHGA
jgi:preprotein translocase subunit SecA